MSKVVEKVIDVVTGRKIIERKLKSRPRSVDKFLKKYPDVKVREFIVCRKPIQSEVAKVLNLMTKGNLDKVKEKYNYDDIFHLYGFLILDNGKKFYIEKNEIVVMKEYRGNISRKNLDCKTKRIKPKNMVDLIQEAERTYPNLYLYSATHDNCQRYIRHIAHTLGVNDLDDFIMQYQATEVLTGNSKKVAKSLTSIGNLFKRFIRKD